MVEDNQIKAQVSPFAIRKGEIKTFDGKDGYVSMNQIVHKINKVYNNIIKTKEKGAKENGSQTRSDS